MPMRTRGPGSEIVDRAISLGVGKKRSKATADEVDLALAWLWGTVGVQQVMEVLGLSSASQTYCRIAVGAREAVKQGKLRRG